MKTNKSDLALAREISDAVAAENKQCWRNAFHGLTSAPAMEHDLLYVEGWVVDNGGLPVPMEHAWLEKQDGTVVDPTPAYIERADRRYFPARRYTLAEVADAALEYGQQPFTTEGDQFTGLRFAPWREAYLRAHVWAWGREATRWMSEAMPSAYTEGDRAIIEKAEERAA